MSCRHPAGRRPLVGLGWGGCTVRFVMASASICRHPRADARGRRMSFSTARMMLLSLITHTRVQGRPAGSPVRGRHIAKLRMQHGVPVEDLRVAGALRAPFVDHGRSLRACRMKSVPSHTHAP